MNIHLWELKINVGCMIHSSISLWKKNIYENIWTVKNKIMAGKLQDNFCIYQNDLYVQKKIEIYKLFLRARVFLMRTEKISSNFFCDFFFFFTVRILHIYFDVSSNFSSLCIWSSHWNVNTVKVCMCSSAISDTYSKCLATFDNRFFFLFTNFFYILVQIYLKAVLGSKLIISRCIHEVIFVLKCTKFKEN